MRLFLSFQSGEFVVFVSSVSTTPPRATAERYLYPVQFSSVG